jgi:hypothetical protein
MFSKTFQNEVLENILTTFLYKNEDKIIKEISDKIGPCCFYITMNLSNSEGEDELKVFYRINIRYSFSPSNRWHGINEIEIFFEYKGVLFPFETPRHISKYITELFNFVAEKYINNKNIKSNNMKSEIAEILLSGTSKRVKLRKEMMNKLEKELIEKRGKL